jgi:hypothetical protein
MVLQGLNIPMDFLLSKTNEEKADVLDKYSFMTLDMTADVNINDD